MDFTALQTSGDTSAPIYHTNVMLAIGSEWAVVCDAIIPDDAERQHVLDGLAAGGRTIVRITPEQVNGFAGNVLEVINDQEPTLDRHVLGSLSELYTRAAHCARVQGSHCPRPYPHHRTARRWICPVHAC